MIVEKMNRRTFLKRFFQTFGALFWISTFGYIYARYVEPKFLTIHNHTLTSRKIPKGFSGKKIVQFSDTHLGYHYNLSQLESLVEQINEAAPDIVLFTGDLMDEPNKYNEVEKVAPILKQINAPLGCFAIYGNHDHGGYGSDIYKNILKQANFKLLRNENVKITNAANDAIIIAGLDDILLGKPNITQTLQNVNEELYTILMVHEPDIADQLINSPISIQLSGHSHGGQIKVPFYGPIYTPPGAMKYYEGFYDIHPSTGKKLYVNRGIGTTRLPFRFFTLPELTVFTLNHEEDRTH